MDGAMESLEVLHDEHGELWRAIRCYATNHSKLHGIGSSFCSDSK